MRRLVLLVALVALTACAGPRQDPELRQALDRAIEAVMENEEDLTDEEFREILRNHMESKNGEHQG